MTAARKQQQKPDFEESLRRLEEIVEQLEKGTVPLENSISMYEEGMNLSRICLEQLNQVELRLKKLTRDAEGRFTLSAEDEDEEERERTPTRKDSL